MRFLNDRFTIMRCGIAVYAMASCLMIRYGAAEERTPAGSEPAGSKPADVKPAEVAPAEAEFFEKHIRPLLVERCYACHSEQAGEREGGLWLDRRSGWQRGGDSGPAVIAGDVDASLLIQAVRYRDTDLAMPPDGKLPDKAIAKLEEWVKRGAPDPRDGQPLAEKTTIDFAEARQHWSFQPVQQQPLPESTSSATASRIDRFVHAELESRGLSPAPQADRRTLIRRLTFDLIGLPPTPEEVSAFVNDRSAGAYERLVSRLLESPHFGERWGRYWLDLARYTDETAKWLNSTGQAHLYRDWVVAAMNEDLPYDEFVRRQLATDMMSHTGPDDLPALGFLGLSPTYWKELKLPPDIIKVIVADEWEERIDVVSRTFLGLTVACARCHDHKFDPITMEDYYALAGVFASTRLDEKPIISAEQFEPVKRARAKVKELEAQLEKLKKGKPVPAEKIKTVESEIAEIKVGTPHFETPMANVVSDAALHVLQAGKKPQDGTKLDYRPGAQDLPLFIRGNPNRTGEIVPRRFLQVLSSESPRPFTVASGRLELADAIFSETAAPLAARVIVNRIWLGHFGRGLVETPSNFGFRGSQPSHPALLEDLTARFIENGWSLKWLHREIVMSQTYRQESAGDERNEQIDPDNRWLWRMNRRRLDIEPWRDAMLAASGTLDLTIGGPAISLDAPNNHRRTLYGTVHRRDMPRILQMHDFPDPTAHSPQRIGTTTALQGLFVLNSPLLLAQADALAKRIQNAYPGNVAKQAGHAYQILFGRDPTGDEIALAESFLADDASAWPQYAQALLGSNEFIYID